MRISDWSSDVCSSDLQCVDAVERLRSRRHLHHRERAALCRAQTFVGEREMIDLRFHDPGNLAVPLGAAPDLAFRPERMLAQFFDRRMIVVGDQVRRSEEHTSELQSIMRISYAVFCLQKT